MKTQHRRQFQSHYLLAVVVMAIGGSLSNGYAAVELPVSTQELRYANAWGRSDAQPLFRAFHSWTERYVTNPAMTAGPATPEQLQEGIALAKQRRAALLEIIKSEPAQALALSVPASVRRQLPGAIVAELETRVSGLGDFSVLGGIAAKGGLAVEPIQRFVHVKGRSYRTYVSGRRRGQTTKRQIPLHGVALDGVLAVAESALRELESGETPEATTQVIKLKATTEEAEAGTAPLLAEIGGRLYRFSSRAHLQQVEAELEAAEAGIGPEPMRAADALLDGDHATVSNAPSSGVVAASSYTEGGKRVLIIRVDFSDLPGEPASGTYTAAYVQQVADDEINPFYARSSYGITSLTNTVTSAVYRMPQPAVYYATNGANYELHMDARTAATANYPVGSYDRVIVLFSWLGGFPGSQIQYGGLGEVGGPNIWVHSEFDFRVVAHELGHTYGLWHGNVWQVADGNPISTLGSNVEYGDDFETMGANFANDARTDFNPWFKNRLNWIHDSQVRTVTGNGIYRIHRFDHSAAAGTLALKIVKDATRNYWIGCRRNFATNPSMQHGAYIIWGYNDNQSSHLLDMTSPGIAVQDAALPLGARFVDGDSRMTIRPVAEGGSASNEYLDVEITFGSVAPLISQQPTSQTSLTHQSAIFTVDATAIPAPTYQWQRFAAGTSRWRDLRDGATYTGTTTASLTINEISVVMSGDQFRCLARNGVYPDATSEAATLTVLLPPANDNFANATFINGTDARVTGVNGYATSEVDEPRHAGNGVVHSVWWKWVAPASRSVSINTTGSDFDTVLGVYTGSIVSTLSLVAADDDAGEGLSSAVEFNAVRGTTYWIAVDGFSGASGAIVLTVALEPLRQLTGMSVVNGAGWFVLNGELGRRYLIQASTNLVDWEAISTSTIPTGGSMLIVDPTAAGKPQRFYRALPQ